MMGGVSLETCRASYKYEIKFWYTVASCWMLFVKVLLFELEVNFCCQILTLHQPKYTLHCPLLLSRFGSLVPRDFDLVSMETNSKPTINQCPAISYTRHTRQNLQYEIRLCELAWNCAVIRTCGWLALELLWMYLNASWNCCRNYVLTVGRHSSVEIATRYGLDGLGIESRWGRDFPHPSTPTLGPTEPLIQWVPGFFPWVKRRGRGVDHPPPHLAPRLKKE
jgi:hypothetical protein